jgi:archaemetzincin
MDWPLIFHASITIFIGLLAYRLFWRGRYRRSPVLRDHLVRVQGTVRAIEGPGEAPEAVAVAVEGENRPIRLDTTGAQLRLTPRRGERSWVRELRKGDRVTADVLTTDMGACTQVVHGTWPQARWLGVPTALFAALALVALVLADEEPALGGAVQPGVARVYSVPRSKAPGVAQLTSIIPKLRPLHAKMGKIQPGDWLAHHKEPGQTFRQYLASSPTTPRGKRRAIYIQPIGPFSAKEQQVLDLTADFMSRYFCLPVKVSRGLPLSTIPAKARRRHPTWGMRQILTTYVLRKVLKPRLPEDASSYLGLTAVDLWPGRGWNFVFGQASLRDRVGVWSIKRNGDLYESPSSYRLFLLRTLKTATHETGHMFSMHHCTAYECNMCGSNNRLESDRRPLALCPECLAKLTWATRCDPAARFRRLASFCDKHGLKAEAAFFRRSLTAMRVR